MFIEFNIQNYSKPNETQKEKQFFYFLLHRINKVHINKEYLVDTPYSV